VRFRDPLIPARFLRREKRFLAQVELAGGESPWVHVPNSGALTGCLTPGLDILLTHDASPTRKTAYTWRFSQGPAGWICIDTLAPNRLVGQALAGPGLPGFPPVMRLRPEVTLPGGGRLDFVAEAAGRLVFVEVKSVTWVEDGVALFPDGVTSRGRRHLTELAALVRQGHEAWQVFVVQRMDGDLLRPAARVDPDYAEELSRAHAAGVKILVVREKVAPPEITLAQILPFDLILSADL
jgi:sugar fermentation stimulation protein A